MAKKITEIEGIGPVFQEKLAAAGVTTVEGLLEAGASKSGRKQIAADSGIDESRLLVWVNMADLFRIKGVASQFAELLKAAGVDTVKEPQSECKKHANWWRFKKKITRSVPGLSQVADCIQQAS